MQAVFNTIPTSLHSCYMFWVGRTPARMDKSRSWVRDGLPECNLPLVRHTGGIMCYVPYFWESAKPPIKIKFCGCIGRAQRSGLLSACSRGCSDWNSDSTGLELRLAAAPCLNSSCEQIGIIWNLIFLHRVVESKNAEVCPLQALCLRLMTLPNHLC